MVLTDAEADALKRYCDGVATATEANILYVRLTGLRLPEGCEPRVVDALLCLEERDGYATRLFLSSRVAARVVANWSASGPIILASPWHVFSWKVPGGLGAETTLLEHLKVLR